MVSLTDHDRRQLERMAERLILFQEGKLSLQVLINDLDFLLHALEAIDADARQTLQENWETLEEVYSVAIGMNQGVVDEEATSLIHKSVATLLQHIRSLFEPTDFQTRD